MDNNRKIQALLIYYKHWGNDQNHQRKIIHGFSGVKQHIMEYIQSSYENELEFYNNGDDEDDEERALVCEEYLNKLKSDPSVLLECLRDCFKDPPEYADEDYYDWSLKNMHAFSEYLLGGWPHLVFLNKDLPTEEDFLLEKKGSLEYFCDDMSEEAMDILYDDDFTEQDVLSVEAIVALM